MGLAQDFAAACRRGARSPQDLQQVGDRLAAAVVEVIVVDGSGLVMFDPAGLAIPIGASCGRTALAEQLQFTVGQGPGYDAHTQMQTVVATEPVMAQTWPAFHDLLVTQTPFRSIAASPLTGPLKSLVTLDVLFHDPDAAAHAPLGEIAVLCRLITADLIEADLIAAEADATDLPAVPAAVPGTAGEGQPVWLSSPGSVARYQVMVAAGILTAHLHLSVNSALQVLKARAYAEHRTTDEVAAALVTGHLLPAAFTLDA